MRGLSGKTVIVTGGGGGIGGATCRRFAAEGAVVAVFDINLAAAERTAAVIATEGGKATAFACDIADHEAVGAAVAEATASLGPIDVLVNNAGWDVFKPFLETSPADWQKLIAINLTGPLNMHHAVLPQMVERRSGRVVNIASGCREGRFFRGGRLCSLQGRPSRLVEDAGTRACARWHHLQCRLPRADRYPTAR